MQLDLNLLIAFDALLDEGSVGGAAGRLHLSQPAMSRTLSRLRAATGDQILVRSGRSMVPTPYALAVRAEVRRLVEDTRAVLSPTRELHLPELATTFTLQCHDAITNTLAPRLLRRVRRDAPGVRLRFLAESDGSTDHLRTGRCDVEITATVASTADVSSHTVRTEGFVVVMRRGHPLTRHPDLTPELYAAAEHVTVSRRGRLRDPVDDALDRMGLARTVVAAAPTSTAALHMVKRTTAVVSVPGGSCDSEVSALGLVAVPLPVEAPPVPLVLSWHRRNDRDAAHQWLRSLVLEELRDARTG